MARRSPTDRRGEADSRARRDLERLHRRDDSGSWWRSLALIGSVGWPIVTLALAGTLIGRALDRHFASGIHLTLMLLVLGTALGTRIAYHGASGGGA
jgi:predicted F0F1-ATPase subunit